MFNATFNNISVISWRSVLLVEETGVPGENYRPVTSHWQTLSHNVVHPALIESSHWQTLSHNVVHLILIESSHWQTLSHNVVHPSLIESSHWQTLSHNVVHPALIESSHWQTLSHNVVHPTLIGIRKIRVCWYWHYYERSKVTIPNYCDNYYYLLLGNLHFRGTKKDGEHILVLSFNVL
jgi:hypothetical protein